MPRLPVVPATPLSPADKLELSLAMFEYGRSVVRENLRRRHPELDQNGIEELLLAWLRERPGAPHGDGQGRLRAIPAPTPQDRA